MMYSPVYRPSGEPSKAELAAYEAEMQAERDLDMLVCAEKIKKDPERLKNALMKRKAYLMELENIKA